MQAGEELFWQELDNLEGNSGERYMVVDSAKQVVLVENAKLVREKKKTKV